MVIAFLKRCLLASSMAAMGRGGAPTGPYGRSRAALYLAVNLAICLVLSVFLALRFSALLIAGVVPPLLLFLVPFLLRFERDLFWWTFLLDLRRRDFVRFLLFVLRPICIL